MFNLEAVLSNYDLKKITIGVLGGHSALDVCHGAKKYGFKTLVVCQKGREKTYDRYFRTRDSRGCVDQTIILDAFKDIVKEEVQNDLKKENTIFIHNRYFWVYCDFEKIENDFQIPIFGSRSLVKLEERDQPKNQYYLLEKARIRTPKVIRKANEIIAEKTLKKRFDEHFAAYGGPLLVKAHEKIRSYERDFFAVNSFDDFEDKRSQKIESGLTASAIIDSAMIEEFALGAQININFFYSPLTEELELMGTDLRRQTNLDGFLRLPAREQNEIASIIKPKMIETGHIACTVKESLLEKFFEIGERFVETIAKEVPPGIIGPFALQGAVTAEEGREDIVIFDVSMRIPGSPGTRFTPYSAYLYGENISYGERIAKEIRDAIELKRLDFLLT